MLPFTSLRGTVYLALFFSFLSNVHAGTRFCPKEQTTELIVTWASTSRTITVTSFRTVYLEGVRSPATSSLVQSTLSIVPRDVFILPQTPPFVTDIRPTSTITSTKPPSHSSSLVAILPIDDCPPSGPTYTSELTIGGGEHLLTVTQLIDVTIIRPVPEVQQTPAPIAIPPLATTINEIGDQLPAQTSQSEQPSSLAAVPELPGGVVQPTPTPNEVPPLATTVNKIGDQLPAQTSSFEQPSSVAPVPGPLETQSHILDRPPVVGEPPLATTLYSSGGNLAAPTQTSTSLRWPDGFMSSRGPLEGATQLIERPSAVLAPPSVEEHRIGEYNGVPVVNSVPPAVPGAPNVPNGGP
jgi:hypothetical protein